MVQMIPVRRIGGGCESMSRADRWSNRVSASAAFNWRGLTAAIVGARWKVDLRRVISTMAGSRQGQLIYLERLTIVRADQQRLRWHEVRQCACSLPCESSMFISPHFSLSLWPRTANWLPMHTWSSVVVHCNAIALPLLLQPVQGEIFNLFKAHLTTRLKHLHSFHLLFSLSRNFFTAV